jgi:hypothetical protein
MPTLTNCHGLFRLFLDQCDFVKVAVSFKKPVDINRAPDSRHPNVILLRKRLVPKKQKSVFGKTRFKRSLILIG